MDYLSEIIKYKREELIRSKRSLPLEHLKNGLLTFPVRSFSKGLLSTVPAIIAEIKRRSPSKGILRDDINPAELAKTYEQNGAAAVSILTDKHYFNGSLEDLQVVKKAVSLPVLRKDFIIDLYQIYESRFCGADALLLISSCLDRSLLSELLEATYEFGMEALVEVENERDIERISGLDIRIVGVNNRNLYSFEQTLDTSFRIFNSLPKNALKISESGIRTPKEIAALFEKGYCGFLIGETLMKSDNPGEKLNMLIKQSLYLAQ